MTFDPQIPLASEFPSTSAVPIQVNFAQFEAIFSSLLGGVYYNHLPMNDAKQGMHGAVIMEKSAQPVVDGDFVALYAHDETFTTGGIQPQLTSMIPRFLPTSRVPFNIPNDPVTLTYNQVDTAGPNQFQSFLPGGYILYFGNTVNIAANITLTPTPATIVMAQAVPQAGNGTVPYDCTIAITQPATLKISSGLAPGGSLFLWMAIAKA